MLAGIKQKPLTLNIPQAEFVNSDKPYSAFVGGYRSGKSFVGCVRLWILAMRHPNIKLGYFAPTYNDVKTILYSTIDEVAQAFSALMDVQLSVEINKSDHIVKLFVNGIYYAQVYARSMERPETIVGFDINHALIDEIDCMKKDKAELAWRKIAARMSTVREDYPVNTVDFTTTPEGFNWVYDFFVTQLNENPELQKFYKLVKSSTLENAKNLPEDYIDKLYATYPQNLVNAYVHGEFVNLTSGTVYSSYDRHAHNSTETIREGEQLFIGMDFNVTKQAATVYVKRNGDQFHAVAELVDMYDTPEAIRIIKEKWPESHVVIYPDASGNSRKSVNASESDISLLRQAGFEVRVNSRNPAVKDRILSTNKAFESGKVFVNYNACPTVARCLEQQAYDKNGEPDKVSGNDHQNDATTYVLAYEMPIIKPIAQIDYRIKY